MSVTLPITDTLTPEDQPSVIAAVRGLVAERVAIYPLGGGTALDYGLPAKTAGVGLGLTKLTRVVDYPARDMTITVEAGISLAELGRVLATERQWLPIDAPLAEQATLGGLVATNFSGPRRYGLGTLRDYVIGITAVDGQGTEFHGGGRVVKNVAGYDFCKLLTGSLGTLGVITQLTLKVKPQPERTALLACPIADLAASEPLLAALVDSQTTPTAIELLAGPVWQEDPALSSLGQHAAMLVVGLEGTAPEVAWMIEQLTREWRGQGIERIESFVYGAAESLWQRLTDFPVAGDAPWTLQASVLPSHVAEYCALAQKLDANCSLQAHAGSGVVVIRFSDAIDDVAKALVGTLHPQAARWGGHATVLQYAGPGELTRQATFGGRAAEVEMMDAVKRQFDPHGLFNPGRFII